jgi:hypothetical protein
MSNEQSTKRPEDIDLDEVGAESVVGGAGSHAKGKATMTIAEAEKAGYHEVACEIGGTLMKNSKGHTLLAK